MRVSVQGSAGGSAAVTCVPWPIGAKARERSSGAALTERHPVARDRLPSAVAAHADAVRLPIRPRAGVVHLERAAAARAPLTGAKLVDPIAAMAAQVRAHRRILHAAGRNSGTPR